MLNEDTYDFSSVTGPFQWYLEILKSSAWSKPEAEVGGCGEELKNVLDLCCYTWSAPGPGPGFGGFIV